MTVVVAGSTGRWRSTGTAITCVIISYLDTGAGDSVSALVFGVCFAYKEIVKPTEMRTRERKGRQSIRTVRDISRDERERIATCSLRTATHRFKEN